MSSVFSSGTQENGREASENSGLSALRSTLSLGCLKTQEGGGGEYIDGWMFSSSTVVGVIWLFPRSQNYSFKGAVTFIGMNYAPLNLKD